MRTTPRPTIAGWSPDFHLFREVSGPILKAGYAGALVYFALQWDMYRRLNRSGGEGRGGDGENADD